MSKYHPNYSIDPILECVGDYFTIKGYGGSHDLKCHYYGKVVDIDEDDNLIFEPLNNITKYQGKAPSGSGAGNWQDTLLEVKRPADIELLFGSRSFWVRSANRQ